MKAKVFLSCGQSKNSDEPSVAEKIWQRIRDVGFDCYMAVGEQSLLGLRENIFAQLESSDYLVFIDFKREGLKVEGEPIYRGSLFSHQELAIASFLEIPYLILQERGLKRLDGMLNAMQANATEFSDRNTLQNFVADLIAGKVRNGEWRIDSRNSLGLEVAAPPFTDALQSDRSTGRFYHIAVCNKHHRKAALYCSAYLDAVLNMETNLLIKPKTVEFKWAGTLLPAVRIAPNAVRELDVVRFILTNPIQPQFMPITDSPEYWPRLSGPGRYRLSFSVQSQNFGTTTTYFILEYGLTSDSVVFSKA